VLDVVNGASVLVPEVVCVVVVIVEVPVVDVVVNGLMVEVPMVVGVVVVIIEV
jgi:hypothetical protein